VQTLISDVVSKDGTGEVVLMPTKHDDGLATGAMVEVDTVEPGGGSLAHSVGALLQGQADRLYGGQHHDGQGPMPYGGMAPVAKGAEDTVEATSLPPDETMYAAFVAAGALEPPIPPDFFIEILRQSNVLKQCLDVYATNVDGFGHHFDPILDLDSDDATRLVDSMLVAEVPEGSSLPDGEEDREGLLEARLERYRQDAALELSRLEGFFDWAGEGQSFVKLRKYTRLDQELIGWGGWEVLRNAKGEVSKFVHVPGYTIRLLPKDKQPTKIVEVQRHGAPWESKDVPVWRYFRRFVHWQGGGRQGGKIVHFRDFLDPRTVSRDTGRYYPTVEAMHQEEGTHARAANEMIYFSDASLDTPYGEPRWIGNLLSVLGSRSAEEVNFLFFQNKSIPPLVLMISGGGVTPDDVEALKTRIRDELQGGPAKHHKILIVTAKTDPTTGQQPTLEFKPLTEAIMKEGLFLEYDKANRFKVAQSMRIPPILIGDTKDFNRACYSDDTETLTDRGWKLHHEIGPDERIAVYDSESEHIRFVVPAEKHVYDVEDEELLRFHNRHTDCLVTSDHTMLIQSAQAKAEAHWESQKAEEIPYNRINVKLAGKWKGVEGESFKLPQTEGCAAPRGHDHDRVVPFDTWLEFLGYWISEGGLLMTDHPAAPYLVYVDQKKPEVRERIRDCLDRLGWTYSVQEKPCGTTHFLISSRCLRDWLVRNCGTHSHDKRIPWEYLDLPLDQLLILFNALMDGDGTVDSREDRDSGAYYSSSTVLAGQVQRLLIQAGCRATIIPGTRAWRVCFCTRDTTRLNLIGDKYQPASMERVRYTGQVYCFSVPGYGFFVTRRNGKVAIQGNTAQAALRFAETQVFSGLRSDFDWTINHLIMSALGARYWRFASNPPPLTDPLDVVDMVTALSKEGVITPGEGRRELSRVGFNLDKIEEPWTKRPLAVTFSGVGFEADKGERITQAQDTVVYDPESPDPMTPEQAMVQLEATMEEAVAQGDVPGEVLQRLNLRAIRQRLVPGGSDVDQEDGDQ